MQSRQANDLAWDLIDAYESEFENKHPDEFDYGANKTDNDGLDYRQDGELVGVSAWLTYGHFRRLKAALGQRKIKAKGPG